MHHYFGVSRGVQIPRSIELLAAKSKFFGKAS